MSKAVAGLLAVSLVGSGSYAYLTSFVHEVKIVGKSREFLLETPVSVSIPRFSDENGNSYKVLPTPWYLQFKSNELWDNLEVGSTYHIKGYGLKLPFISPNVYSAELVNKN